MTVTQSDLYLLPPATVNSDDHFQVCLTELRPDYEDREEEDQDQAQARGRHLGLHHLQYSSSSSVEGGDHGTKQRNSIKIPSDLSDIISVFHLLFLIMIFLGISSTQSGLQSTF